MKISSRMYIAIVFLLLCLMMTGCFSSKSFDITDTSVPVNTTVTESKEEKIYSIVKEINVEEKMKEILSQIANINWHSYNETSGEQSMDLIQFILQNQNYINISDFPNLILATKGLDGAWSESFAAIVGGLFIRDRDEFIKALADSPDIDQQKRVIGYIAYNLNYYDVQPIIKELEQLSISEIYSTSEKEVIASLLVDLEYPY